MRILVNLLFLLGTASFIVAQANAAPPAAPNSATPNAALASDLDRLQAAAAQANMDISHVRIEKWKADSASKQQAQANADSLQRNLTSALPGLIGNFRAAPQDLNAGFKLYRNLNALFDVLASFTESTGAFGQKNDYDELAQQLNVIDSVRRDLGDNLEGLTSLTESELNQLRMQVHTLQQQAAAPAPPPKKVVVDNSEPAKKTTHKKKTAMSSSNSGAASGNSSTATTTSKSQ